MHYSLFPSIMIFLYITSCNWNIVCKYRNNQYIKSARVIRYSHISPLYNSLNRIFTTYKVIIPYCGHLHVTIRKKACAVAESAAA